LGRKKNIHIIVDEEDYYKAKEVFPRYGEITNAVKKILLWIIRNPDEARKEVDKIEI